MSAESAAPAAAAAPAPAADASAPIAEPKSLFELSALDSKKKRLDFSQYKGKVVLVVNVASKCGFTPQYKGHTHIQRDMACTLSSSDPCCVVPLYLAHHSDSFFVSVSLSGLETLYKEHVDQGLVILGFPCNGFGSQVRTNISLLFFDGARIRFDGF